MNRLNLIKANKIVRDIDRLKKLIDKDACGPSTHEYLEVAATDHEPTTNHPPDYRYKLHSN